MADEHQRGTGKEAVAGGSAVDEGEAGPGRSSEAGRDEAGSKVDSEREKETIIRRMCSLLLALAHALFEGEAGKLGADAAASGAAGEGGVRLPAAAVQHAQ